MNLTPNLETIKVTNHARRRGKLRMGINSAALNRMAEKASKFGLELDIFAGSFRDFLDLLLVPNDNRKNIDKIKIYGEIIYLFKGNVLITLIKVPTEFKKTVKNAKNNCNRKHGQGD